MARQYRIMNTAGEEIGGDSQLDDVMKGAALLARGYIVDESNTVVYESPGYKESRDRQPLDEPDGSSE